MPAVVSGRVQYVHALCEPDETDGTWRKIDVCLPIVVVKMGAEQFVISEDEGKLILQVFIGDQVVSDIEIDSKGRIIDFICQTEGLCGCAVQIVRSSISLPLRGSGSMSSSSPYFRAARGRAIRRFLPAKAVKRPAGQVLLPSGIHTQQLAAGLLITARSTL